MESNLAMVVGLKTSQGLRVALVLQPQLTTTTYAKSERELDSVR
jgi:hypothetical protein